MFERFKEALYKSIADGLLYLLGLLLLWGLGLAWAFSRDSYTFTITRRQIVICILFFVAAVVIGVWITRRALTKRHSGTRITTVPVDVLQQDVLRLLWNKDDGVLYFPLLPSLLNEHPNLIRIACDQLQKRQLIAYNPYVHDSSVQLLPEGREYAASHNLTDVSSILKRDTPALNRQQ